HLAVGHAGREPIGAHDLVGRRGTGDLAWLRRLHERRVERCAEDQRDGEGCGSENAGGHGFLLPLKGSETRPLVGVESPSGASSRKRSICDTSFIASPGPPKN